VSWKDLTDAELDARVIRELSCLPSLSPRSGFSDRVMSRVRLPQPKAVVLFHRARRWAMEPRRALALAGSYAALVTVALVALVPWLLGNSAAIGAASDWVALQVVGVVREWTLIIAGWAVTSGLSDWLKNLNVGTGTLVLAGGLLTAGYGASAILLHRLLRAPRGTHATVQA
jgi:hypothetical protein